MSTWLADHRARLAAARQLGARGEVIAHTPGGSPILRVGVHHLAYRRHGSQRYWRLSAPCARCGSHLLFADVKIESADDLARMTSVAEPELLCHTCQKNLLHLQ